eukprot:GHVU01013178.1.p4 GENE.GHVU01013178.1~~GHVU01013178.1.p4  ORF type:complete len:112 (+),score=13.07 GHVU01013178.1:257-592(+)
MLLPPLLKQEIKDNADYQDKVKDTDNVVIMQYSASWCGPCRQSRPQVEKMSETLTGARFYYVDIEANSELADKAAIEKLPTFVIMKDGKKVDSIEGLNLDRLQSAIEKYTK